MPENNSKNNSTPGHLAAQSQLVKLFTEEAKKLGASHDSQLVDTSKFSSNAGSRLKELYSIIEGETIKGMNIFSRPGDRVIFQGTAGGGAADDVTRAQAHLIEGETYIIKSTFVSDSFSFVMLEEHPDLLFNTMFFSA